MMIHFCLSFILLPFSYRLDLRFEYSDSSERFKIAVRTHCGDSLKWSTGGRGLSGFSSGTVSSISRVRELALLTFCGVSCYLLCSLPLCRRTVAVQTMVLAAVADVSREPHLLTFDLGQRPTYIPYVPY